MSKPRTGAPKRVAVGLLAGALAIFGVALAPNAGATTTVTTDRLAGATRYGTAAAVAADAAFGTPSSVIIATGQNFPDALAASTLSGSFANPAPILLTDTNTLSQETAAALDTLKGKGVTTANIVGGTSAVSNAVQTAITTKGFTVTRVAGTNRFETASAIATAANSRQASGTVGGVKTALIATGDNFPDALAGGPAAERNDLPLLLVTGSTVPASTQSTLTALGIKQTIILGGTAAVPEAVATSLQSSTGSAPVRLAGTNRFGTAAAVGNYEIATLAFPATTAILATGQNFPDALAAGPLAGVSGAPIVLTASLPAESTAFLDANSSRINRIRAVGGTAVIDDATLAAAKAAAQNVSNDQGTNQTVTTRPELVSTRIVGTVTNAQATVSAPAGTTVAYTFDEAVTGSSIATTGNLFHLYRYSTPNTPVSGGASSATVSSSDPRTVNVLFTGLTTTDNNATTGTADLSVATVDLGAVTDNQGQHNPEGAASVGSGATTSTAAGTTTAPDLVSVGRFGGTPTLNQSAVDFTFDQAAFVQTTTGFHLVLTDGTDVLCTGQPGTGSDNTTNPGGQAAPGGNGTTTITVQCGPVSAANSTAPGGGAASPATTTFFGSAPSAANVARGYVERGTVGTATLTSGGGTVNPLESSNAPDSSTTGPDLLSAVFATGSTVDSVVYTFDEPVLGTGLNGTRFRVYSSTGTETVGINTGTNVPARNSDNTAQVVVFFPTGTVASATGASAAAGAVQSATGTNIPNQPDEVGAVVASTTTTPTNNAGRTVGPDLTGVLINKTNNSFGQLSSVQAVFIFDKQITNGSNNSGLNNTGGFQPAALLFRLYLADGSRILCTSTFTNTTSTFSALPNSAVLCASYTFDTTPVGSSTEANTNTGTPTAAQVATAVLGAVDNGAVNDSAGNLNPEGAAATGGGNGTPAA